MRLTRTAIHNFRSIEILGIDFQPSCRVLVGINESGKSNILRALSLLDPDVEISDDDLREIRPNEKPYESAFVWFVFTLTEAEKLAGLKRLESKISGDLKNTPVIRLGKTRMSVAAFVRSRKEVIYKVDLLKKTRAWTYFALSEPTQILAPWKWVKSRSAALAANAQSASYQIVDDKAAPVGGAELTDFEAEDLNHLVAGALNEIAAKLLPTVIFWRYDENQLLPGEIPIAEFSADPDTCVPLKHMFELAGYEDIETALDDASGRSNGMRNLLRRVSRLSTKHLHQVWKEYQDVDFELVQNGNKIDAHVIDRYNTYDLSRRSDGFKRFVSFLLHISVKARANGLTNTLYLDDEPDVGLHPSGARYLRDELVKVSRENYVVYATHSIFMVDGDHLERHLMVSKKNEITRVEEANETNFANEEVIFNALGYSIFEQLRRVNIVFEGWRDKRLFEVAMASTASGTKTIRFSFADVGRCFARGVKDVGRVTAMLELARRQCVILSDSDQPAREHQRAYRGYGDWFRYDQLLSGRHPITGEDFVDGSVFVAIISKLQRDDSRLVGLNPMQFGKSDDKVSQISGWLRGGGLTGEDIKVFLERVKEAVFTDLKPDQIEPEYFELLKALAAKLPRA